MVVPQCHLHFLPVSSWYGRHDDAIKVMMTMMMVEWSKYAAMNLLECVKSFCSVAAGLGWLLANSLTGRYQTDEFSFDDRCWLAASE